MTRNPPRTRANTLQKLGPDQAPGLSWGEAATSQKQTASAPLIPGRLAV
jgi:hypothetical protein